MNRLKKFVTYTSLAILLLRGILWFSNQYYVQKGNELFLKGQNLQQQADSVRSLRKSTKDTIAISNLKRLERKLLKEALDKQFQAKEKFQSGVNLLDNLELAIYVLLGFVLLFFVVLLIKEA